MPADPTEMTHCPTKQEEDTNLDPAQTEKIKVLLASFHSDHKKFGHTATPEEVFINYGKTQQLGIQERDKMFRAFLLAWPSTGFLLYNISEFFQKIDFVLEFAEGEITQDLSSPFVFLSESHHSYWRWKFDEIIMGVRCSRLAELKSLSKAKDHVKMCELLRMRFNTMEESTQGLVIVYLQSAEAYSRALKEGLDTLDRIDSLSNRETQLSQVTKEGMAQSTIFVSLLKPQAYSSRYSSENRCFSGIGASLHSQPRGYRYKCWPNIRTGCQPTAKRPC